MDSSTGMVADIGVREGEQGGARPSKDASRTARDDLGCSAEPLIGTDKYRFAIPTFRPEELRD